MNKKQKKVLIRVIVASVLLILCAVLPTTGYVRFATFMVPYLVIGYDILKKAWKGILNKQVFDENFLMAVATVGAILLGEYPEGVAVMLFYQIGEQSELLLPDSGGEGISPCEPLKGSGGGLRRHRGPEASSEGGLLHQLPL